MKEEAIEEENKKEGMDNLEEIEVKVDEGGMLTLSANHPQKEP